MSNYPTESNKIGMLTIPSPNKRKMTQRKTIIELSGINVLGRTLEKSV